MKKVLIVDDQTEVRELVRVTLNSGVYHIFQASNGEDAVRLAEAETPDLIIMDIMMPGGIDGLEAARRIRQIPACAKCSIVMLTAKGQETDRQASLEAGANNYFSKPFSPLELIRKVEEILG
ncbi:MAG: response regulator [Myxococcales bacterium]|nr:MAG: response regulator [Myxococcales bacterium]